MNEVALDAALSLAEIGDPDAAEKILRGLSTRDLRVAFNLGWHDLRHGAFQQGFEGLNKGRYIQCFGAAAIPGPIWKDQDLAGKTVLLRNEGGLGDEIINFRFHREFRQRGANVVVAGAKSLLPLFARHGVAAVTPEAIPHVQYDYWVPAMSAAYVLGYEYFTLPGAPYLTAVPHAVSGEKLRVGLRWGGNREQTDLEPKRKLPVQSLLAAVQGPNVELFSFQRDGDTVVDFPGVDLQPELTNWEATARWLKTMDVLITSCTSVAHLAAALGVQTWVLTPVLPYYTWALSGEKTPWHHTVTLFRQEEPGTWETPLARITERLRERTWAH